MKKISAGVSHEFSVRAIARIARVWCATPHAAGVNKIFTLRADRTTGPGAALLLESPRDLPGVLLKGTLPIGRILFVRSAPRRGDALVHFAERSGAPPDAIPSVAVRRFQNENVTFVPPHTVLGSVVPHRLEKA